MRWMGSFTVANEMGRGGALVVAAGAAFVSSSATSLSGMPL